MAPWHDKFGEICKLTHTEQAQYWLNAFWGDETGGESDADRIWEITHVFLEMELGRPVLYGRRMLEFKEGCDLDEMKSHVILEKLGETLTVVALRARLKAIDLDFNKRMALTEYLIDKYGKDPAELCNRKQGDLDPAELKMAEEALENASNALNKASEDAETARNSAERAAEALKAQEAAEAEVLKAKQELEAADAELKAQEDEYNGKIKKFQDMIDDASLSAMKKARANNELAQLKAEDPLPLRRAKITSKAALKRVEKEVKKAEAATAKCAEEKKQADEDQAKAEAAKAEAEEMVKLAEKALADLMTHGASNPMGKLYWMDRTLKEKKKFM